MTAITPSEHHSDGHEEHPDLRVWGLFTFLASESLMFGGFFATYLFFKGTTAVWPPEGTDVELFIPAINTIILVSSSFVIHFGDMAIKRNSVGWMRFWYFITAIMGAAFLAGQVYEYMNLGYGFTTNVFANCFYLMTGFPRFARLYWIVIDFGCIMAFFPSWSLFCYQTHWHRNGRNLLALCRYYLDYSVHLGVPSQHFVEMGNG